MVDPDKLVLPPFNLKVRFPGLDFRDSGTFETHGEPVLVTDPIYLADVYNVPDGLASVVRQRGVIITDFGGDTSGPVYWQSPFMVLAVSAGWDSDQENTGLSTETRLSPWDIGCDSGSFVFLPLTSDLPSDLLTKCWKVRESQNGAFLSLPAGEWTILFEQDPPIRDWWLEGYRNIILRWQPPETLQPRLF